MDRKNRPNAFFIEIVIVLLFFSLSAAVILQLFVMAHNQSTRSREQSASVIKAQDIAEQFKAYSSPGQPFAFLPDLQTEAKEDGAMTGTVYLDAGWEETSGAAKYVLHMTVMPEETKTGTVLRFRVRISKAGEAEKAPELYHLEAQKYVPAA